jgi:glucose-specific phosphotransferase system IIA component
MGFLKKLFSVPELALGAPVAGQAVPITEVNDPTFREEIVGKGLAIRPSGNTIVSPCDGTVELMFDTGHAVSVLDKASGAEVLIHVGLETVGLKGRYFKVLAKTGDTVSAGTPLIEFDREAVAAAGYDTITPVVVCNPEAFSRFSTYPGGAVAPGDKIIGLVRA